MTAVRRARRDAGFSLLEIMVSLAILGMGLVIVSRIVTGNVRATVHARMTTAATFLARTRISMMEQSLAEYGFGEMDGEDSGDFTREGFPSFRWYSNVERIELPADATQKVQQASTTKTLSNNPLEALSGFMGGFMSMLMEPIRLGLQESIRKLTVKVKWNEAGKPEQFFEVVYFITDPSRLETAVSLTAAAGGQGNPSGTPGAPGSGPTGNNTGTVPPTGATTNRVQSAYGSNTGGK
jgi:prepilin-type N-terminal cleavage/methylation domain-containing protein